MSTESTDQKTVPWTRGLIPNGTDIGELWAQTAPPQDEKEEKAS